MAPPPIGQQLQAGFATPAATLRHLAGALTLGADLEPLIDQAIEQCAPRGTKRILLAYGATSPPRLEARGRVAKCLARHGTLVSFAFGTTDTDTEIVPKCVDLIARRNINVVVAFGGGRVMDIAKVCASFREFDFTNDIEAVLGERHELIPRRPVTLIAIPTTPGTGSEATPYAVLTGRGNRKLFAISADLCPDAGLVCPELYRTVPAAVTRQSLMDGFMHALEALWAKRATPLSDSYACEAIARFGAAMQPFYRNPLDIELAATVATAAAFGGLAFASAFTSVCHALSFPLAERLRLGHGQCCSLTAAQVAEFNRDYETPAILDAARSLGLSGPDDFPSYLRRVRESIDDRATLTDFDLTNEMLTDVATSCDGNMVSNNGKPVSAADLGRILRNS